LKTFLYWSALAVLAAGLVILSVIHFSQEDTYQPQNFLYSLDRQWILSGDQHLFDVTQRAFDIAGVNGYKEGRFKWTPLGSNKSPFRPHFVKPEGNATIKADEHVLGVFNGETATAYPLRMLAQHMIVNDETQEGGAMVYFGAAAVSSAAYVMTLEDRKLTFGPTGLTYLRTDLVSDLETESLFLPMTGTFVSGRLLGERLEALPSGLMTLREWLSLYPDSRIMTTNVGQAPMTYPFLDLSARPAAAFAPATDIDAMAVIGVRTGWEASFITLPAREKWKEGQSLLQVGEESFTVHFTADYGGAYVTDSAGALAPSFRTMRWGLERLLPGCRITERGR